jgi:hypothetical protein
MPRLARLLPLLAITLVISAEDAVLEGSDGIFTRVDFKPFYLETDVGTNDRERKKFASGYARTVSANLNHFLRAFGMKAKDFDEFARFYGAESGSFDPAVRIRLWRRFEPFLQDLQTRYDTKAIAGAYKGQIRPKDEYGEFTGPMFREIGVYVEGRSKQEVLRGIYHEMGHLFMQTFIKYPSEVPSWLGRVPLSSSNTARVTALILNLCARSAWLGCTKWLKLLPAKSVRPCPGVT